MGHWFGFATLVVMVAFLSSAYFFPIMPDFMVSHWDAQGIANGSMPKFWALFLVPIISLALLVLFFVIPTIDPLKQNIQSFRKYYDRFVFVILAFMLYIHALTLMWNLGFRFSFVSWISPAFALLFYFVGTLLRHAKQNWFIGIRTPWTLSDERVWEKTNRLGARLFQWSALVSVFGLVFQSYAIWLILIPILTSAIYLIIYSYVEFQKLNR